MYQLGQGGLTKDEAEAVRWYRKSADQGNALGQNNLGSMYQFGLGGLTKDEAEAVKWYRKAAAQGQEKAQENLKKLGL
jgi:TPR repeat protein